MKNLKPYPFHLFLLPVFFVAHAYLDYFYFIGPGDILLLAFLYLILAAALVAIAYLFFRDLRKSCLIAGFMLFAFFFYGAIHVFLKAHTIVYFFSRHSILFPLLSLVLVCLFFFSTRSIFREQSVTRYLNILFLILVIVDVSAIVTKAASDRTDQFSIEDDHEQFRKCDTCAKPDIYFLLFDEHESSSSLKDRFGFSGNLDSFLLARGFNIASGSRSNYQFTPFSMASILNMSFISGIRDINAVDADDYSRCNALIKEATVFRFVQKQGYKVINYSIFDLEGSPSLVMESFLPGKTRLITDRTFSSRIYKDLGWIVLMRLPFAANRELSGYFKSNKKLFELSRQSAQKTDSIPKFVYAHLQFPHQPYFFDKNGRRRPDDVVYAGMSSDTTEYYLDYLRYSDTKIQELVGEIQQNNASAVIVLMGDHGYRNESANKYNHDALFKNLNAVYIPGSHNLDLYDHITGVNQFRVIFNTLFHQNFPMLKDSVVRLVDK